MSCRASDTCASCRAASVLELDLHQAQRAEPEGLDKNHQEGDHSHGDAHLHGFLGGVAAGVLTLANQDGQVMEGQDVVEVDSGENDQCNGNRRYAGSLNKGEGTQGRRCPGRP